MKTLLIASVYLCLFSVTAFAQPPRGSTDWFMQRTDSMNKAMIGKPYPDFKYKGDDGVVYSNKTLLGKKYYINFWFEGCHPCMDEMPELVELSKKLKGNKNKFISFTWDEPAARKRVKEKMKINFPVIALNHEEAVRLNLQNGYPTHIVVDEKGMIEYIGASYMPNDITLKEITAILIK